jgi:hypothetical protein
MTGSQENGIMPSNNQSSKMMWPFEGLSLASATALANVAGLALVACILGGLVSTFVFVQATGVKERHLSGGPSSELRQKVRTLESELDKAKTAVADANGRVVEAKAQLEQMKAARVAEQAPPPNARARELQPPAREAAAPAPAPAAAAAPAPAPAPAAAPAPAPAPAAAPAPAPAPTAASAAPAPAAAAAPAPAPAPAAAPAPVPAPAPSARANASRTLSDQQVQSLIQRMSSFKGHHVTVGASPATTESGGFADQLVLALRSAGVSANRNDASAGIQIGSTRGVVARYVTGNDRGERFAKSLAEELTADGISAKATGGLVEEIMKELVKLGRAINDPANEWVVIAVGDKAS